MTDFTNTLELGEDKGLDKLFEYAFSRLEYLKMNYGADITEVASVLQQLERIVQDVKLRSQQHLIGKMDAYGEFALHIQLLSVWGSSYLWGGGAVAVLSYLTYDLARARDLARDRARDRALVRARDLARVRDRVRVRALARALTQALALALNWALALDLAQTRAQIRDLDLDLARDLDLDLARDLARDLALDLAQTRDLDLARARDRDRDRDLDRALALARDLDVWMTPTTEYIALIESIKENTRSLDVSQQIRKLGVDLHHTRNLDKRLQKAHLGLSALAEYLVNWEDRAPEGLIRELQDLRLITSHLQGAPTSVKEEIQIPDPTPTPQPNIPPTQREGYAYEWDMEVYLPGDYHEALGVSQLIWSLSAALESVPGVKVELYDMQRGSLRSRLRIWMKDLLSRDGVKDVVREVQDVPQELLKAQKAKHLEKPQLEAELLKQQVEQADEDKDLDRKIKEAKLRSLQLQNAMLTMGAIEKAAELLEKGLDPFSHIEISLDQQKIYIKREGKRMLEEEVSIDEIGEDNDKSSPGVVV